VLGWEDIYPVYFYLNLIVAGIKNVDVRFAKYDEEVTLSGILKIVGHVQVGVHPGLEYRNTTQLVKFR